MSKNIDELKKSYLETRIPNSIDESINNMLIDLPKKNEKRSGKFKKVASIIVVLGLSTMILLLGSSSARASIKSLFGLVGFSNIISGEATKYSEELDYSVDYKGYKIKINEVIFTQNGLVFTYTLDKKFIGSYSDPKMFEKLVSTEFDGGIPIQKIMLNGKAVTPKNLTGYCRVDDTGENIIGYQSIILDELNENDKLELEVNKVGFVNGEWKLKFKTNIKLNPEDVFVLKEKIKKENENAKIEVEELVSTPMFTYAVYTLEINENLKEDYNLKTIIVNENSREMNSYVSGLEKREEISSNKYRISTFLPQYEGKDKTIKFIPTLGIETKKAKIGNEDNIFKDINVELPLEIDFSKWGKVRINSIEENENKIFINCDLDGVNKDMLINSIWIAPKSSEAYFNNPNIIANFNPLWMDKETYNKLKNFEDINNITISFDKYDDVSEYSLGYSYSLNRIDILDKLVIEIKVGK